MPTGQDAAKAKLNNLIKGYGEGAAIDWLRCKFPSFETGSARKISIGESKGEKDYLASARLLGHITRLPEKSGDTTSNRPLVVVAVEMKGDMTERTSRAGQFAFAKRVLRDAVNSGATGLDGLPSQGLFFFHDANGAFRISLVTGEVEGRRFKFNEAKRQSFFVRPGASNNIIRRRFHDPIKTFGDLKEAFSVEQLTKEFYRELFNWYEWAKDSGACFPNILNEQKDPKKEKQYNHEAIIRLITRLMFTWFIRQRKLVPAVLFSREGVSGLLKKFDPDSMVEDNYYRAILQNLFFATFNTPQSGKDKLTRRWINAKTDARGNGAGLTSDYHVTTVYRYKDEFKDSDGFLAMMRKVPFLNCALFDCLDKIEPKEDGGRRMYFDGFSTKQERRAHVPNGLFFGDGEEGHMGIITLFDQYEFTIDENEVNDGDVALDPELLGKVFENLLGAYNPETQATARNATGSFYTPREIVDYMVEESLKNYLRGKLSLDEKDSRIDELFDKGKAAEKAPTGFSHEEEKAILEALYACRIIDPACGSGAFPMGILNCMVRLLKRLDDDTGTSIREYLLKRYREDKDRRDPTETEEDRQERLEEIEKRFGEGKMYPDYARKLYLIENCIYGVDIQPIAAQISKLRFFISLLCDQFRTSYNPESDNYGLLSLPNLEAKFVCANTLIALPDAGGEFDLTTGKVGEFRDELVLNRHKIFGARSTKTKEKYKAKDKEIRSQIREAVRDGLSKPDAGKIAQLEKMIEQAKKRRKEVEKPEWIEVEKPVQQDFFSATSTQPMLMKIDRNEDKRNDIDSEIDKCNRAIAKEQAKGGKDNIDAATKYADLVAGWDPFDQNASSPFFDPAWMFNIKDGFDIVIGNPPYRRLSENQGELADLYCECGFRTFVRSGDIYCLFYEKGYNILGNGGCLCFVTSDKWMRSEYGNVTRKFFIENTRPILLVDFAGEQIFDSATVETNVLLLGKSRNNHSNIDSIVCKACIATFECRNDMIAFVRERANDCTFHSCESWVVLSLMEQSIQQKLKIRGKPLNDWGVKIYRGVLSGFSEAFIIGESSRDDILSGCCDDAERARTDSIIKPVLRGRDVSRYACKWANLYLISTFPAYGIDIEKYKSLEHYLLSFGRERLEQVGKEYILGGCKVKTRKKTGYKWYETQDAINYWREFLKPKILWMDLSDVPSFAYDEQGLYYANNTVYFLTGDANLKYIVGYLNSKLAAWQFMQIGSTSGVGTTRWQAFSMSKLRVPCVEEEEQTKIVRLVDRILDAKKTDPSADTSAWENDIDALVYKLYGITDEKEIAIIEGRDRDEGCDMRKEKVGKGGGHAGRMTLPAHNKAHMPRKSPRNDDDDEVLE